MLGLMETKKNWNLSVFESVADEFDRLMADAHRGSKGTCATASVLLFLVATPIERQRFVDIVKLAEGRGLDGTVLDAAKAIIVESAEETAARQRARTHEARVQQPKRVPRRKRPGKKKQLG